MPPCGADRPLVSSVPLLTRPTRGDFRPLFFSAYRDARKANWSSISAVHSVFAPASHSMTSPPSQGRTGRECRAADTLNAAAVQRRAGQQRAGVARGDERIALACLEQLERDRHGRVRLAAQNGRRVIVHVNDIRGRHDGQMLGVLQSMRAQHGGDRLGLADEQDILAIFLRSERRTSDGYVGGVVAAHRVNDDLHSQSSPFRLSMRSSARSEIFAFFLPLALDLLAKRFNDAEIDVHRLELRDRVVGNIGCERADGGKAVELRHRSAEHLHRRRHACHPAGGGGLDITLRRRSSVRQSGCAARLSARRSRPAGAENQERVAVHHAVAHELGVFQRRDHGEHALLLTELEVSLAADQIVQRAVRVVAAQLKHRIRVLAGFRVRQTDGLKNAEPQRIKAAAR